MNFEKLVPNIFYVNITDAFKLFIDCLGFTITHDEIRSSQPFCVLEKDGLRINLFENPKLAKEFEVDDFYLKTIQIIHPENANKFLPI